MIRVEIITAGEDQTAYYCDGDKCKHLPEFIDTAGVNNYWIKFGSPMAIVRITRGRNYDLSNSYCRDCIDQIYREIKSKMDTKLWAFQ